MALIMRPYEQLKANPLSKPYFKRLSHAQRQHFNVEIYYQNTSVLVPFLTKKIFLFFLRKSPKKVRYQIFFLLLAARRKLITIYAAKNARTIKEVIQMRIHIKVNLTLKLKSRLIYLLLFYAPSVPWNELTNI